MPTPSTEAIFPSDSQGTLVPAGTPVECATPLLLRRVLQQLPRYAYRFANELELHAGIDQVLSQEGVPFQREFVAGPQDRFDFYLPGGIVIEAKTKGSLQPALLQAARYLEREDVSVVVLAVTRYWGRTAAQYKAQGSGKLIHTIHLKGAAF